VTGPISVFLCTISGTFTAADVTAGASAQGIGTGEYDELVRAIDAGKTYANVHTTTWPGGEIRAQLNEDDPHN
jgi:CHRD domain